MAAERAGLQVTWRRVTRCAHRHAPSRCVTTLEHQHQHQIGLNVPGAKEWKESEAFIATYLMLTTNS